MYFSVFGQYILTPEVFTELETNISNFKSIDKCGLRGVVVDGKMFDVCNAEAYNNTMRHFSK